MSTQSKAKRYVSLGFDELDQLQELGWGERAMYLELKRLANFKTGKVGVFRSQVLTWEELGRRVSVPSAQGRAAKLVDGKEAALMVGRLEAAGLVADQGRRENGGLTLTLPLSPIEKAATAAARPARQTAARAAKPGAEAQPEGGEDAGSTLARMPDDWADEIPENIDGTRVPEVKASIMSVMMLSEHLNKFFNTETGSGDTPAPCPPQAAIPTPIFSENSPGAVRASLTLADIRSRLAAANFIYLTTRDSNTLMEGWITREVSLEALEKAIAELVRDDSKQLTPAAVDRCLRTPTPVRKGRGRVAL